MTMITTVSGWKDLSDATIAAILSSKPSRYPQQQQTQLELVNALIAAGRADAIEIVDRVMDALEVAAAASQTMKSAYHRLLGGGTIDVGSPAMRGGIIQVGGVDGEAIVAAYPLAVGPITEAAVADMRSAALADEQRAARETWFTAVVKAGREAIDAEADYATTLAAMTAAAEAAAADA